MTRLHVDFKTWRRVPKRNTLHSALQSLQNVPAPTRALVQPLCPALLFTRPRLLEVLLLAWGVFFMATHDSSPKQMARKFANPLHKSKRPVVMQEPSTPDLDSDTEQQPTWSTTHGRPRQATGISNGGSTSANERAV